MGTKTVYTTAIVKGREYRLRGDMPEGGTAVAVGISNGGMIGWYNLDRFEGGKLTARTLRLLFETPEGLIA